MASTPDMVNIPFLEQEQGLLSQLNAMRLQHQLCDVTVRAGEQEFHCHQAVLAASSGHFHSIFVQGVLCFPKKPSNESLDLSFVSPEVFTIILDFIYTANLKCPAEIVGDVLKAAKMLEIPPLIKQLPVFVAGSMNSNKVQRLSVDTPQPTSSRPTCSSAPSGVSVPDSLTEMLMEPDGSADQTASTSALGNVVVKQELSPSPPPENELIDYYGQEGSPIPHEEDGQEEQNFPPDLCGKNFTSDSSYQRQQNSEENTTNICNTCSKSFPDTTALQHHMVFVHKNFYLTKPRSTLVAAGVPAGNHWPRKLPGQRVRNCVAGHPERKRSRYECPSCNVGLCAECFGTYHQQLLSPVGSNPASGLEGQGSIPGHCHSPDSHVTGKGCSP